MASPGRGLAAGLGAIVASAAAVLILYALGWFSPASHVAHGTPARDPGLHRRRVGGRVL